MKKTKEKERTTFDVEVDWAKPLLEAAAGRRNLPSPPEGRAQEEREGVVEGRAHEGVVAGEGHCRVFLDAGGDGRKKREDSKKGQKMCVSVCFRMKKGKKKLFSHFLLPPTTACFSLSRRKTFNSPVHHAFPRLLRHLRARPSRRFVYLSRDTWLSRERKRGDAPESTFLIFSPLFPAPDDGRLKNL